MNLPKLENLVIVHYGCSDFNTDEHRIFWIGAISHKPNKTYFFESRNEVEVIEKFERYIQDNNDKTFIHWSMNSPKFGFRAIENRFFQLTNKRIDLKPKNGLDLSEYLKTKYSIDYIERKNGRLNNLAKLNNFSGIQSEVEVININDATNRLELLFSIVQAELQGKLKVNSNKLKNDYKNENWFKIGLMFATGEMNELLKNHNNISTQIAKYLGNESGYRPYISESIGVNKYKSDKSIFASLDKMQKLIDHCEQNNINVIDDFLNEYNRLKAN